MVDWRTYLKGDILSLARSLGGSGELIQKKIVCELMAFHADMLGRHRAECKANGFVCRDGVT